MNLEEFEKNKLEIEHFLMNYQWDNKIENEWLLRMLLEIAATKVSKFKHYD